MGCPAHNIAETDSLGDAYEASLRYAQWMDMEATPIQTIDDAMKTIGEVYG
jgi:hypothetical protein